MFVWRTRARLSAPSTPPRPRTPSATSTPAAPPRGSRRPSQPAARTRTRPRCWPPWTPPPDDEAARPMTLSTHVLDATTGRPAAGMQLRLERGDATGWVPASQGQTDGDGRLRLAGDGGSPDFEPGVYRITFATGAYFGA